jgi:DNA-binding transcriptional LysR family regulator
VERPDLNLLVTLDVLLAEGSVVRAAHRLGLSPSAMSRALSRLRAVVGDPLLVRAGRKLVPTKRALELRDQVRRVVGEAETVLRPEGEANLKHLRRTFTMRSSDGFVETFGPALLALIEREAPGVRVHFLQKPDKDSALLRDGTVDLETGVVANTTSPELRTKALFRDRRIVAVRKGHPLTRGTFSAQRYAEGRHISISRLGLSDAFIDEALAAVALERNIAVVVGGFAAALALARQSDLIATVPERHTAGLRDGLETLPVPFPIAPLTVAALWHPRMDADPAHRWFRTCVMKVCQAAAPSRGAAD